MEIIRRSIKAYVITILVFMIFTLVLGALIRFTAFREEWGYPGMLVILSMCGFIVSFLEGKIIGKRGLFTGIIASIIFVIGILFALNSILGTQEASFSFDVFWLAAVITGAIGGVVGTNSNK